jgi:hypothetical protein
VLVKGRPIVASQNAPDKAQEGTVKGADLRALFHRTQLELAQQTAQNDTLAEEVTAEQMQRIFAGETLEEIMRADTGGTIQGRDCDGLEVRIYSIRRDLSTRDDLDKTQGYFFTMPATALGGRKESLQKNGLEVGQDFTLQSGAELFCAKLAALEAKGLLPIDGVITSIKTRSNNDVIKFWPMPERPVQGSTA